jgi:hypothetical protein
MEWNLLGSDFLKANNYNLFLYLIETPVDSYYQEILTNINISF